MGISCQIALIWQCVNTYGGANDPSRKRELTNLLTQVSHYKTSSLTGRNLCAALRAKILGGEGLLHSIPKEQTNEKKHLIVHCAPGTCVHGAGRRRHRRYWQEHWSAEHVLHGTKSRRQNGDAQREGTVHCIRADRRSIRQTSAWNAARLHETGEQREARQTPHLPHHKGRRDLQTVDDDESANGQWRVSRY